VSVPETGGETGDWLALCLDSWAETKGGERSLK
jgi:hypothetical protein